MFAETRAVLGRTVLAAFVLMVAGCAQNSPPDISEAPEAGRQHPGRCGLADRTLAELAHARGKTIGTAYRSTFADDDPCHRDVALADFDSLTTEIGTATRRPGSAASTATSSSRRLGTTSPRTPCDHKIDERIRGRVLSELHVSPAAVVSVAQQLRTVIDETRIGLANMNDELGALLGTGWTGQAGSAFGHEWQRWHEGAADLVRGLEAMAELLDEAAQSYRGTDTDGASAVDSAGM